MGTCCEPQINQQTKRLHEQYFVHQPTNMSSPEPVAAYHGSFHFVNKDASNLNTRGADEAFSISSHITNKYYRWSKTNKSRMSRLGTGNECQHQNRNTSRCRNAETLPRSTSRTSLKVVDIDSRRSTSGNELSNRTICWQIGSGANPSPTTLPGIPTLPSLSLSQASKSSRNKTVKTAPKRSTVSRGGTLDFIESTRFY